MSVLSNSALNVYAPFASDGSPRGANMAEAQAYHLEQERLISVISGGAVGFATLADANASLAYAAGQLAYIFNDTTVANNGIYTKTGASGSGSWTRRADLPYEIIPLTITSGTTPNTITATSAYPVTTTGRQIFSIVPNANNTGASTLAINNGAARPVVDNMGAAIGANYLRAGQITLLMLNGTSYQGFLQADLASSVAAVAADRAAAEEALADIQLLLDGVNSASRRRFVMTAGQTVINVGVMVATALYVYYDGLLLDPVTEYTVASPVITLTEGAAAGALVDVIEIKSVNVATALIGTNDLADVNNKKNSRHNLEITKVMTGPDAAATISADSRVVHVSAALTAPRTYTLPAANAVNPGEAIEVFDTALGVTAVNTLTVQRAGSDTINGATSVVLASAGAAIRLVSDGISKWAYQVIGQDVIDGQCRLVLNGANLELQRFKGRRLWIGTAAQIIPSSPPTLAATGLTPGTVYYIYAFMNAGTMTLEASTTAPAVDASFGHHIKTGDASRSLVGMARPVTGPAWVDTAADRGVISFFNRRALSLFARFNSNRTTTSTTSVEIDTEIRCKFLSWGDDAVSLATAGGMNHSVSGEAIFVAINLDGATDYGRSSAGQATTANASAVRAAHIPAPSIGGHYATVFGNVAGAGTATFFGGANNFVALSGTVIG